MKNYMPLFEEFCENLPSGIPHFSLSNDSAAIVNENPMNEGLFGNKKKEVEGLKPDDKTGIFKTFMEIAGKALSLGPIKDAYAKISNAVDGHVKLLDILKKAAEDNFGGTVATPDIHNYRNLVYVPAAEKGKVNEFGVYAG